MGKKKTYESYKDCEIFILTNGINLKNVPNKWKFEYICKRSVLNNGLALEFVP